MSETAKPERIEALQAKYGQAVFDNPMHTAAWVAEATERRDRLDQHYAKTTLAFMSGVMRRPVLDEPTRLLVLIGQYTVGRCESHLEDALRVAFDRGLPERSVFEAIGQAAIYAGDTAIAPALAIFERVAAETGALDRLGSSQPPLDGGESTRDRATEEAGWPKDARDNPNLPHLIDRFGWPGVSTGIRLRGRHHPEILRHWEALDPEFAELWETYAYRNMYSRSVLDDRTRILCTIGDVIVVGATTSAKEHIRSALGAGATPREILEVILLTGVNFGFPKMTTFQRIFEEVITDLGRLAEIGNPPVHPYDVRKV